MERTMFVDERQELVDQLLSLEVAYFAQRDTTAEVLVAVRVAAGAAKRTLARDLDGKSRCVPVEDPSPRGKDAFHSGLHYTSVCYDSCAVAEVTMKRRTLLQWTAALAGVLPFQRLKLFAQPRELTTNAIAMLREIAPTILPSALGAARTRTVVDRFAAWTRGYREGIPLAHGYGHPRLVRSGATPVPAYLTQLTALETRGEPPAGAGPRSIRTSAAPSSTPRSRKPAFAICRRVPPASTWSPI